MPSATRRASRAARRQRAAPVAQRGRDRQAAPDGTPARMPGWAAARAPARVRPPLTAPPSTAERTATRPRRPRAARSRPPSAAPAAALPPDGPADHKPTSAAAATPRPVPRLCGRLTGRPCGCQPRTARPLPADRDTRCAAPPPSGSAARAGRTVERPQPETDHRAAAPTTSSRASSAARRVSCSGRAEGRRGSRTVGVRTTGPVPAGAAMCAWLPVTVPPSHVGCGARRAAAPLRS